MSNRLAILITCFNRKKFTLNCIKMLYQQDIDSLYIDIYLVDDGSTDGTGKVVKDKFPDVTVIKGNGNLYWNGGMRLAWKTALEEKYDFYLWVNDDSMIYPDAILRIISSYDELIDRGEKVGAVLGSMVDPDTKKLTYGGRLKCSKLNLLKMGSIIQPKNIAIKCDFVNGNLTLIPAKTVDKIGMLSNGFTHSMGDFDYGLRASNAGLDCWVAPGIYGECSANSIEGSWQDTNLDISIRLKKMKLINQLPPLDEWKIFIKRHTGVFWVLLYLDALLRDKLPRTWLWLKRKL